MEKRKIAREYDRIAAKAKSTGRLPCYEKLDNPVYLTTFRNTLSSVLFLVKNGGVIVDAGCGGGVYTIRAARIACNVVGIDISKRMIETARKRAQSQSILNKISLIIGDLENLPLRTSSVKHIICPGVLEHVPDTARVINEQARILKPEGTLVLLFPNTLYGIYWKLKKSLSYLRKAKYSSVSSIIEKDLSFSEVNMLALKSNLRVVSVRGINLILIADLFRFLPRVCRNAILKIMNIFEAIMRKNSFISRFIGTDIVAHYMKY